MPRRDHSAPRAGAGIRRIVPLGGFRIRNTRSEIFARYLRGRLLKRQNTAVFFANANFVVACRDLAQAIAEDPDIVVVNDGVAVQVAARARHGVAFRENLNGTDFMPLLLRRVPAGTRLYLLGGTERAVDGAARAFQALPAVEVVGKRNGYEDLLSPHVLDEINAARPDILLVALGNPLQEQWILENRAKLSVPIVMAVGALFDFTAGIAVRAPRLVQRLRLEWAFRLYREPRRLMRRYTIETLRFFLLVAAARE